MILGEGVMRGRAGLLVGVSVHGKSGLAGVRINCKLAFGWVRECAMMIDSFAGDTFY